jgi:RNA polymerase sigma-70 factor (ECF subfamily)
VPQNQREVLILKILEGLTFREIAAANGESINTIASRYRYGLEKLRALLENS